MFNSIALTIMLCVGSDINAQPQMQPPIQTWITIEELNAREQQKLHDLMLKEVWGDCVPGDPVCSSIHQ